MTLHRFRDSLRNSFFRFWEKAVQHHQGKSALIRSLDSQVRVRPEGLSHLEELPYRELGKRSDSARLSGEGTIFVTARFRSGSTLLWNVFRQFPEVTAYYEPFNERRWFDPTGRGSRVDATHRGVSDYWQEYEGLGDLHEVYREQWIREHLYMDQHSWDPQMKRYIDRLIEHAPQRAVLQFNRVDFRLPWIRHHYPQAKIIHLYRHPREQWCSTLKHSNQFGPDQGTLREFQPHDHFYLSTWVNDLRYRFACLHDDGQRHPYHYFYLLWRLSHAMGVQHADLSIRFEALANHPQPTLDQLTQTLELSNPDTNSLLSLIQAPTTEKWRNYASDAWFAQQESECEGLLAEYFPKSSQPNSRVRLAG